MVLSLMTGFCMLGDLIKLFFGGGGVGNYTIYLSVEIKSQKKDS